MQEQRCFKDILVSQEIDDVCKQVEIGSSLQDEQDDWLANRIEESYDEMNWKHITVSWQRFRRSYLKNPVLLNSHWNRGTEFFETRPSCLFQREALKHQDFHTPQTLTERRCSKTENALLLRMLDNALSFKLSLSFLGEAVVTNAIIRTNQSSYRIMEIAYHSLMTGNLQ
ncbi:hypothetical protein Tco_1216513 [Tanacetum coccineum]